MNNEKVVSRFESKRDRKDVRKIWISESVRAIDDRGVERICYEEAVKNITEKKSTEDELQIAREHFRNLLAYLQLAIEHERKSISREIHDELGQLLTAIKMDLIWIKNKMPASNILLIEKAESMLQIINNASDVVQRIAAKLRPRLLDDLGLTAAIEWQIKEFQNRTGIPCEVTLDSEDIFFGEDISTAIYRILQETLTNIMRHSNATQVSISLKELNDMVELQVSENGKGITKEQIFNDKSIGIIGMKERARLLDGNVDIVGNHREGTIVTVRIPHEEEIGIYDKSTHCR